MYSILIIDQQIPLLETLSNQLNGQYRVLISNHVEDAVHMLKCFRPDLVIADFMMPGLQGLELVARIKETDHSPKIMLLSSGLNEDIVKRARGLGVTAFMTKPFDLHDLRQKIFCILVKNDSTAFRDDPDKIK